MTTSGYGDTLNLLQTQFVTGLATPWQGGDAQWTVWGTWNGATAQLQYSPDSGTTWIDLDGATMTANGGFTGINIGVGKVRTTVSGAGGSTSLSSIISRAT